ncbi:MAG: hypothetical protein E6447_16710 [Bradyrhizobium sp.]|nr:hypothetical protein [Bradyrhizobium sp.]
MAADKPAHQQTAEGPAERLWRSAVIARASRATTIVVWSKDAATT